MSKLQLGNSMNQILKHLSTVTYTLLVLSFAPHSASAIDYSIRDYASPDAMQFGHSGPNAGEIHVWTGFIPGEEWTRTHYSLLLHPDGRSALGNATEVFQGVAVFTIPVPIARITPNKVIQLSTIVRMVNDAQHFATAQNEVAIVFDSEFTGLSQRAKIATSLLAVKPGKRTMADSLLFYADEELIRSNSGLTDILNQERLPYETEDLPKIVIKQESPNINIRGMRYSTSAIRLYPSPDGRSTIAVATSAYAISKDLLEEQGGAPRQALLGMPTTINLGGTQFDIGAPADHGIESGLPNYTREILRNTAKLFSEF